MILVPKLRNFTEAGVSQVRKLVISDNFKIFNGLGYGLCKKFSL